uniref:Uncharacterized protein n=1 Tax=Rhizophora mucronata TaxID=61149 RepID=A0A2P2II47_RHIMU
MGWTDLCPRAFRVSVNLCSSHFESW